MKHCMVLCRSHKLLVRSACSVKASMSSPADTCRLVPVTLPSELRKLAITQHMEWAPALSLEQVSTVGSPLRPMLWLVHVPRLIQACGIPVLFP